MNDFLTLRPLDRPRINEGAVSEAERNLKRLAEGLERGSAHGQADLVEVLRARLRQVGSIYTFAQAIQVPRLQWRLLKLYSQELSESVLPTWLPALGNDMVNLMLRTSGSQWHRSRRRDVTLLYFRHFDRIDALTLISNMLLEAWTSGPEALDSDSRFWNQYANWLFAENAVERVAGEASKGESAAELLARFRITSDGRLAEAIRHQRLLGRLMKLDFGANDLDLFHEIEDEKETLLHDGSNVGSRAVKYLVNTAISQGKPLPPAWANQLVRFACDPRIPNTAAQQKWWRWATEEAKRTAIDALAGLTISEFLALLDDSLSSSNQRRQFKRRKLCLLQMLKEGLIADARLVIHDSVYSHLDSSILKSLMPEVVRGGGQKASFICLRCINDVFLIEGTHNFALRGFVGEAHFPIRGFWTGSCRTDYQDYHFRVTKSDCDVYQVHSGDHWIDRLFEQLRDYPHHIHWPDLNI